jgi:hypothetical protein
MQPNLFHQELAHMRYAEALREASRHYNNVRREPALPERNSRRSRLLRRLRPVFGS